MELFLEFLAQQWILAAALAAALIMLWMHEARKSGQSVSPQEAINLVNAQDGLFLDLRDGGEFGKGHIVDALNIPVSKLDSRLAELEKYRDKPLILVCKMGQQSGAVGKKLGAEGFTGVHRMSGGMMEWGAQQLPLVKQ
jgi:rhodanese-related sulfurtransferase